MADNTFTPPTLDSYKGQADTQFVPPPLESYRGQEQTPKTFGQHLADVPRSFMDRMNEAGQGIIDLGKSVWGNKAQELVQSYGQSNLALYNKAIDAFNHGDPVGGTAHFLNYLINGVPGIGTMLDNAGEKARQGRYGESVGDTLAAAALTLPPEKTAGTVLKAGTALAKAPAAIATTAGDIALKIPPKAAGAAAVLAGSGLGLEAGGGPLGAAAGLLLGERLGLGRLGEGAWERVQAAIRTGRAAEAKAAMDALIARQREAGRTPLWETPPPDIQPTAPAMPAAVQGPLEEPALPSGRTPGGIQNQQPIAPTAPPTPEAAAQAARDAHEAAFRDQVTQSLTGGSVKKFGDLNNAKAIAAIDSLARQEMARYDSRIAPQTATPEPAPQPPPAAQQTPYVPSMPEGTTLQDLLRQDLEAKRAAAQAAAPPETPAAAPETASAAAETPEATPQPKTVEELSNALNQALAEEPAKPKTVEEYKAQARAKRAAATPQWADYLQSKGITADDVAKWGHREKWRFQAQAEDAPEGLTIPTGKGAAAILEELRKREAAAAKAQAPSKIPPVRPYPPPEGFFSPSAIQKLIDIQERQARERAAQQFGR